MHFVRATSTAFNSLRRIHVYPGRAITSSALMSASENAPADDGNEGWWEQRKEEVERVNKYVQSLDIRVKGALKYNPAESLVSAIAETINTVPRIVRRVGSHQRSPMSYFHFIFHKPRGLLCQPRQLGRRDEVCVRDSLPPGFPPVPFAGRLDADTEGLLLFSDNGKLLHALIHPSSLDDGAHVEKIYYVQCSYQTRRFSSEPLTDDEKEDLIKKAVDNMREPIDIKGSITQPALVEACDRPDFVDAGNIVDVEEPTNAMSKKRKRKLMREGEDTTKNEKLENFALTFWISVRLREGKNRQIRRLCKRANLQVRRLIRSHLGPLALNTLKAGEGRSLTADEVKCCYELAGMAEPHPGTIDCPLSPLGEDMLHLIVPPKSIA